MIKYIFLTILLVFSNTVAYANDKMDLAQLNKMIEQTNFIVNGGCSGTLIDLKNKLILTNHHCIAGKISIVDREETGTDGEIRKYKAKKYAEVIVEQNGYNNYSKVSTSSYIAEIVAENLYFDLAVLKIKSEIPHNIASRLLPETMTITRGETVYIVGNPGLMEASLVKGIVSSLNRTFEFPWTNNEKLAMIQFSGGIFGGNSGGALYNEKGYIIGVPAAGMSQANFIGLAIPIHVVRKFMRDNCLAEAFDDKADNTKCMEDRKAKEKNKPKSE